MLKQQKPIDPRWLFVFLTPCTSTSVGVDVSQNLKVCTVRDCEFKELLITPIGSWCFLIAILHAGLGSRIKQTQYQNEHGMQLEFIFFDPTWRIGDVINPTNMKEGSNDTWARDQCLVKNTPHAPGMLFVGVALGRDPTCVQKQKSFLETHEFGTS